MTVAGRGWGSLGLAVRTSWLYRDYRFHLDEAPQRRALDRTQKLRAHRPLLGCVYHDD